MSLIEEQSDESPGTKRLSVENPESINELRARMRRRPLMVIGGGREEALRQSLTISLNQYSTTLEEMEQTSPVAAGHINPLLVAARECFEENDYDATRRHLGEIRTALRIYEAGADVLTDQLLGLKPRIDRVETTNKDYFAGKIGPDVEVIKSCISDGNLPEASKRINLLTADLHREEQRLEQSLESLADRAKLMRSRVLALQRAVPNFQTDVVAQQATDIDGALLGISDSDESLASDLLDSVENTVHGLWAQALVTLKNQAEDAKRTVDTVNDSANQQLVGMASGLVGDREIEKYRPERAEAEFSKATSGFQTVVRLMGELIQATNVPQPDESDVRHLVDMVVDAAAVHRRWCEKKHPKNLAKKKGPYDEYVTCGELIEAATLQIRDLNQLRKDRLRALREFGKNPSPESVQALDKLRRSGEPETQRFAAFEMSKLLKNTLGDTARLEEALDCLDAKQPQDATLLTELFASCDATDNQTILAKLPAPSKVTDVPEWDQARQKLDVFAVAEDRVVADFFQTKRSADELEALFENTTTQGERTRLGTLFAASTNGDRAYMERVLSELLQRDKAKIGGGTEPLRGNEAPVAPLKGYALSGGGQDAVAGNIAGVSQSLLEAGAIDLKNVDNSLSDLELQANIDIVFNAVRQSINDLKKMTLTSGLCHSSKLIFDAYAPPGAQSADIAKARILVGGHIVLRILNPMIIQRAKGSRAAIYATKVIQNISNDVHFGGKEQYMIVFNPLVDELQDTLNEFLDSVVQAAEQLATFNKPITAYQVNELHAAWTTIWHDVSGNIMSIVTTLQESRKDDVRQMAVQLQNDLAGFPEAGLTTSLNNLQLAFAAGDSGQIIARRTPAAQAALACLTFFQNNRRSYLAVENAPVGKKKKVQIVDALEGILREADRLL